jgi:DNA (cytosine-5)-methyltransferase 1
MPIKHLELFSGVGGFRYAMDLLHRDFGVRFDSVGFSELDSYAINTYKSNFETANEVEIGDIVSFVSDKKAVRGLPAFDFLTGGFPCQAFSMMGKQKGFDDLRGNVFLRY